MQMQHEKCLEIMFHCYAQVEPTLLRNYITTVFGRSGTGDGTRASDDRVNRRWGHLNRGLVPTLGEKTVDDWGKK